jgi:hypothetical protein
MVVAAVALLGCGGSSGDHGDDGGAADGRPAGDAGAADTVPAVGCASLAPLPLTATLIKGPPSSEDFTFDRDGYLVALEGARSLVRLEAGGRPELVFPNIVAHGRGLRVLAGGDVVIADDARSLLVRVDATGAARRLTTTIVSPNGVALGPRGRLYVTDFGGGGVYRVDPDSGEAVELANPGAGSNGVGFDRAYTSLYVGDHDTGVLSSFALGADGSLGPAEVRARGLGKPDGLATDECGNVYVASWDTRLYRVSAAGAVEVATELGKKISAVAFGSGRHGWDERTLYVMNIEEGGVFAFPLGVRRAPPP